MSLLQNSQDDCSIDQVVSWLESACPREMEENVASGRQMVAVLQGLKMDRVGLIAGLLQSLLNGLTPLSESESAHVDRHFGAGVITLYHSINRIRQLSDRLSVAVSKRSRAETDEENLRKMLITMVDDVRVVQICLANQLVLLRASKTKTVAFQKIQARLTEDIYAPLANRLGIGQLKWELEDFAFRYLRPHAYHALASELEEKRQVREHYIVRLLAEIQTHFRDAGIDAELQGRPKHIYSIWKKMQRKDLQFKQLWDIRGVRILVHNVEDCYSALSVIHSMWQHIPDQFSDYISVPKINGYQSIHSVVIGPQNKSVEVQIRTYAMHEESELGVAAHWRYKEKLGQDNDIDSKVVRLRRLLDWKNEVMEATATADEAVGENDDANARHEHQYQQQRHTDQSRPDQRIYVFTPKGSIVDLPAGSTPIDFAYAIHSEVGHRTRGAQVNGKMVPLNYTLQTTEQVHIQTVKSGAPSRDWLRNDLGGVRTNRARSRILQWFKHADYDQNVSEGRAMLERELHRLGLEDLSYEKINQHTHFQKVEDLLAAIGAKDFKLSKALYPFKPALDEDLESIVSKSKPSTTAPNKDSFRVHGVGNLLTRMAKCCRPLPGDQIIGFIASGRGVSIHRRQCSNILNLDESLSNRLIDVDWGEQSRSVYNLELQVTAYHRSGLLHEITEKLKAANADVISVNMETNQEHVTRLQFRLEITGTMRPEQLISRLSSIQNVFEVRRD